MYPNINAERARQGLTVDRLTKKLGVSRKTYYNWISKRRIPQSKLNDMSKLFNVSVDYLLSNNN